MNMDEIMAMAQRSRICTGQDVIDNPKLKWDWWNLSHNKKITGEDVLQLLHKPWRWDGLWMNNSVYKMRPQITDKLEMYKQCKKMLDMCIALHELEIPDLQLYMIFDELHETDLTLYQKWLITRVVKRQ